MPEISSGLFILFIGSLIAYRVTSFLCYENGPFDVFVKFRDRLGITKNWSPYSNRETCSIKSTRWHIVYLLASMICCFKCTSFWIGLFIAWLFLPTWPIQIIILWGLAISAGAIVIERAING